MGPQLVIRKKLKKDGWKHFENVLNRDTVARKDIDENEKVCDTLDVKEDTQGPGCFFTVKKSLEE